MPEGWDYRGRIGTMDKYSNDRGDYVYFLAAGVTADVARIIKYHKRQS